MEVKKHRITGNNLIWISSGKQLTTTLCGIGNTFLGVEQDGNYKTFRNSIVAFLHSRNIYSGDDAFNYHPGFKDWDISYKNYYDNHISRFIREDRVGVMLVILGPENICKMSNTSPTAEISTSKGVFTEIMDAHKHKIPMIIMQMNYDLSQVENLFFSNMVVAHSNGEGMHSYSSSRYGKITLQREAVDSAHPLIKIRRTAKVSEQLIEGKPSKPSKSLKSNSILPIYAVANPGIIL